MRTFHTKEKTINAAHSVAYLKIWQKRKGENCCKICGII